MGKTVLIVDDSASMRQMVNFTLSEEGFDVVEAANGKEGIDTLNSLESVDLLISDINMPIMDGIEMIKGVRQGSKHKFVPIIILTTESEDGKKKEGIGAGASAWIVKPFTPDKLVETALKLVG